MKVPVKYIILLFAFITGWSAYGRYSMGLGIAAGGAFIAYALIEIQDLKIINKDDEGS